MIDADNIPDGEEALDPTYDEDDKGEEDNMVNPSSLEKTFLLQDERMTMIRCE